MANHQVLSTSCTYCSYFLFYHPVGDAKNASKCAGTYLLMLPDDEVMIENIEYYKNQTNITDTDFNPRQVSTENHLFNIYT